MTTRVTGGPLASGLAPEEDGRLAGPDGTPRGRRLR